jgi:hypothetical protein
MAAPIVLSDEQLFQLTGSWEAAAALRDEQNNALNQYNWSQAAPAVEAAAPVAPTLSAPVAGLLDLPTVAPVDEPPAAPIDEPTVAAPIAPIAPVQAKTGTQQVVDLLVKNPSITDAEIAKAMETYKVSPADLAKATVSDEGKIAARVAATLPANQAVLLGDTYVQAVNTVTGSGMDEQIGGIERVVTYKAGENKVGGDVKQFSPEGKYEQTTKQQEVDAAKDFGKFLLTAGTIFGLPAGIGEAVGLGTGATANAVGTGLLSSGSAAIGGADLKDIIKAGVIGGGASLLGSTVSDLVKPTIDASTLTSEEFNDLINKGFSEDLKKAGVKNISEFTTNVGGNAGTFYDAAGNPVVTPPPVAPTVAPTTTADNLVVTGARPTVTPSISNVISAISTQLPDAGTVKVEDKREKNTTLTPTVPTTSTVPELTVTGSRPTTPTTPITPIVPTVPLVPPVIAATPPTPPKPTTPSEPPPKKETTITDVIKTIAPLVLLPAVASAVTPTKTSFPIVPVPPEWTPPPVQPTTPFQPLTPIDFGNQNLLKGTQWEKFLDPNYGKVPAPTQYSQPSNLSYNDLMSILGSKQGMPPTSSLSINDVISGIQNQYGQVPVGAVGAKPA